MCVCISVAATKTRHSPFHPVAAEVQTPRVRPEGDVRWAGMASKKRNWEVAWPLVRP